MEQNIPKHLMEVGESFDQRYQPVLDFEGWRVAMLRHSVEHDKQYFKQVEKHNETNEVFILTEGEADMIICMKGKEPGEPFVFSMRKNVAYNLQKAVWHNVIMSKEAHIVLFEKTNTTVDNSDYYKYTPEEADEIKKKIRDI